MFRPLKSRTTRIEASPQANLERKVELHRNEAAQQALYKITEPTH